MKNTLALILPCSLAVLMQSATSGAVIVIATNAVITSTNVELQGHDIIISNSLVSVEGTHSFSSLQVLAGAEMTHGPGGSRLDVTAVGDMIIASGARIRVDGKGSSALQNPGSGRSSGSPVSGSGGGHGGSGGVNAALSPGGLPYGSYITPTTPGSAGGSGPAGAGGPGGGVVLLQSGGTLRIDGSITANGANGVNSRSGGGSGGSIYLRAAETVGGGSIAANGGNGEPGAGGGGGGGRVSIQAMVNHFAGQISAHGGFGFGVGGAGTIFTSQPNSGGGELVFDNGGRKGETPVGPLQGGLDVRIQGGAVVTPQTSMHVRNLTIISGSLRVTNQSQSINAGGNTIVEREGRIEADRVNGASGPGAGGMAFGVFPTGGGGGHGGYGGAGTNTFPYGGGAHGSLRGPVTLGGRGGGMLTNWGAGGGAIRLTNQGMLLCNGVISASGGDSPDGAGGGGAGGSIWITAGSIAGTGEIIANGGRGNRQQADLGGGGGGGGRIAIHANTNLFRGTLSARGGEGGMAGGAGTIFTAAPRFTGAVLVDNGGLQGTNTAITEATSFGLTVQNGAVLTLGQQGLSHLILRSNGWISATAGLQPTPVKLGVTGHAVIEEGSGIRIDGTGYPPAGGPGRGWEAPGLRTSSGASHGGHGGAAAAPVVPRPSEVYGSISSPADLGSGGAPPRTGGAGGGSIVFNITGTLALSGTISANGLRGTTIGAGGGAGGSINIDAGVLLGAGSISADGGDGVGLGGGGAGGRIALRYGTNAFYGRVTAHGGRGEFSGGPGTVYLKNRNSAGLLRVENGGQKGTTTLLQTDMAFDLEVGDGAQVWGSHLLLSVNNLTIGPASALLFPPLNTNVLLKVAGFAQVAEGGLISLNGAGHPIGTGPGAGVSSNGIGSGAGHGGRGGASLVSAGGATYGSAIYADSRGSGGGRGTAQNTTTNSSAGGGALRLQASRGLLLDGAITANGRSAEAENAGGGSGGSVWIETPMLLGSGLVEARGGNGETTQGGGGGGGRVAIYAPFDSYLGAVDVGGGTGYMDGEAGTITFLDTLPANAAEPPSLQVTTMANDSVVMTWPGKLGTTYRTLVSTDLTVWEPYAQTVTCTTAGQLMRFTFTIESGPHKFYRVAIE